LDVEQLLHVQAENASFGPVAVSASGRTLRLAAPTVAAMRQPGRGAAAAPAWPPLASAVTARAEAAMAALAGIRMIVPLIQPHTAVA